MHAFVYTELGAVDENRFPITGGQTKSESRSLLQVNHYMTKSLEEYRARSARNRPNPYGPQNPLVFGRPFDPELLAMREELAGARRGDPPICPRPPRGARSESGVMSERWAAFARYASWVHGKPDVE